MLDEPTNHLGSNPFRVIHTLVTIVTIVLGRFGGGALAGGVLEGVP